MLKIYADFNNADETGRIRLNTVGSLQDINRLKGSLAPGISVVLYTPGDFEVAARVEYDGIWIGIPDWSTITYLEG